MSPWIVGFCVFLLYPLGMNVYLSLTHYDLLSPPRWVGLANYRYAFTKDPDLGPAIKNTLWIIAVGVPCQVIFAFGIAAMVTRAKAGVGIFRTVFYLPALVPPVAATLGFVYILNPATGPINTLLGHLGIQGPLWFNDPGWSKPSLVLLAMWGVGNFMIIFLAAILEVPRHLYESAELDGAGPFQKLRWVTLPTISPVILFAVVLGVIYGLQYFTQAWVAAHRRAERLTGGRDQLARARLPRGLDALLPNPPLLPRLQVLQHGLRVCARGSAAGGLVRRDAADRP